jgi:hypothetical protein
VFAAQYSMRGTKWSGVHNRLATLALNNRPLRC